MGDLFAYLRWRGDLRFSQDGFNEIDSLIFARLSYIPFEEIVTEDFCCPRNLGEVAQDFLNRPEAAEKVLMAQDVELLKAVVQNPRTDQHRIPADIQSENGKSHRVRCKTHIYSPPDNVLKS